MGFEKHMRYFPKVILWDEKDLHAQATVNSYLRVQKLSIVHEITLN